MALAYGRRFQFTSIMHSEKLKLLMVAKASHSHLDNPGMCHKTIVNVDGSSVPVSHSKEIKGVYCLTELYL